MISHPQVEQAQASWGSAVVAVGAAPGWDEARARAVTLVEDHYLLGDGSLLFCPTRVAAAPFRSDVEAAVSYMVGGNPSYPEDNGFALEPWASVRFKNAGIVCRDDVAMAMGHYLFGRGDGTELEVEYSFVYVRDDAGRVVIQLHHSALPYRP
jgi:hypothetical protein